MVALPPLTALVFSRGLLDVFHLPKALLLVAGGICILVTAVIAWQRAHTIAPRLSAVTIAAIAVAVFAVVATATAQSPWRAVFGGSGARAGLAVTLACVVIYGGTTAVFTGRSAAPVLQSLLWAAVPIVAYGVAQALHADPFAWRQTSGGPPIFSTFGNANFFSAWIGVVAVVATWGAINRSWRGRWRVMSALLGSAGLAMAIASRSIQGPIAALAGIAILVAAALTDHGRHAARRRLRTLVLASLPVLVVGGGAAMLAIRGGASDSFGTRVGKWQAATAMGADHPVSGVGLDLFVDWYHAYRPVAEALSRGLWRTADAAHNVPLQLFAGGGVPLAVSYVAFVGLTGVMLVRALRRSHGPDRLMVGAVGGAWVAYQVQSLVSIDTAPLAVVHWILAGLLAAAATRPTVGVHRPHQRWGQLEAVATTLVVGAVAVTMITPLRADVAARRALRLSAQGRHADAEASFERALRLDPWEPFYPMALARQRVARGDLTAALHAYSVASARQPRSLPAALEHARIADRAGRTATARLEYHRAIALDPHSPLIRVLVARHYLAHGQPGQAVPLLEQAVASAPRPQWLRLLERARARVDT